MSSTTLSVSDLDVLIGWYQRRTGNTLRTLPLEMLQDRLLRAMGRAGATSPQQYILQLTRGDAPIADLIAELSIKETYFFRDRSHFDFIREEILPAAVDEAGRPRGIRAWCAGCSTGEEPYSLAMLLAAEGRLEGSRILATDLCPEAVEKAQRGVYRPWSLRGSESDPAVPHLEQRGDLYHVFPGLRSRVQFDVYNLIADEPPEPLAGSPPLDLVFCRNVLIYFDIAGVKKVVQRFFDLLAPGGWLIPGPSDPPLQAISSFSLVHTPHGLFYRRERGSVPRTHAAIGPPPVAAPPRTTRPVTKVTAPVTPAAPPPPADPRMEARLAFRRGDYARVLALAPAHAQDPDLLELHVRTLAALEGPAVALEACSRFATRHPLRLELHFLEAQLMEGTGDLAGAVRALRRALYVDRGSAAAHLMLGRVQARNGAREDARRSYRNALQRLQAMPADHAVDHSDGALASELIRQISRHLGEDPGGDR